MGFIKSFRFIETFIKAAAYRIGEAAALGYMSVRHHNFELLVRHSLRGDFRAGILIIRRSTQRQPNTRFKEITVYF